MTKNKQRQLKKSASTPVCHHQATEVLDSRHASGPSGVQTYLRRRKCLNCGLRFSTREIPVDRYQELLKIEEAVAFLRQNNAFEKGTRNGCCTVA